MMSGQMCVKQKQSMYNIHQFNEQVRTQERLRQQQEQYAKYLLRHEDYKEKASEKVKQKAHEFVNQQHAAEKHFVFEDDHFINWRRHRQYRDIQDHTKFLSFKSFRHKPHYQMDKYFNERERKEIQELSARKEHLVKANIIPEEQRSRSLRCQGPLCPKVEFRQIKKDHEYLQPRLRFHNVTDKQRQNESSVSYDQKFKQVYNSFQMTKSKIGKTSVSPTNKRYDNKQSFDFIDQTNSEMSKSKPFYFERQPSPDLVPSLNLNSNLVPSQINPQNSSLSKSGEKKKSKTYFKLAKTIHLFSQNEDHKEKIGSLLKRSQFQREKDLTNIKYNLRGENYIKRPIL